MQKREFLRWSAVAGLALAFMLLNLSPHSPLALGGSVAQAATNFDQPGSLADEMLKASPGKTFKADKCASSVSSAIDCAWGCVKNIVSWKKKSFNYKKKLCIGRLCKTLSFNVGIPFKVPSIDLDRAKKCFQNDLGKAWGKLLDLVKDPAKIWDYFKTKIVGKVKDFFVSGAKKLKDKLVKWAKEKFVGALKSFKDKAVAWVKTNFFDKFNPMNLLQKLVEKIKGYLKASLAEDHGFAGPLPAFKDKMATGWNNTKHGTAVAFNTTRAANKSFANSVSGRFSAIAQKMCGYNRMQDDKDADDVEKEAWKQVKKKTGERFNFGDPNMGNFISFNVLKGIKADAFKDKVTAMANTVRDKLSAWGESFKNSRFMQKVSSKMAGNSDPLKQYERAKAASCYFGTTLVGFLNALANFARTNSAYGTFLKQYAEESTKLLTCEYKSQKEFDDKYNELKIIPEMKTGINTYTITYFILNGFVSTLWGSIFKPLIIHVSEKIWDGIAKPLISGIRTAVVAAVGQIPFIGSVIGSALSVAMDIGEGVMRGWLSNKFIVFLETHINKFNKGWMNKASTWLYKTKFGGVMNYLTAWLNKVFGTTSAYKDFYKGLLDTLKKGYERVYGTGGHCKKS